MPHHPYSRINDSSDTAILFVHGIVGSPEQFSPLLPLVPQDWSIVNLLLPGHGGSVQDFSHANMAAWRQHVHDAVEELAASHDRILLAGHSMGTLFCIAEALHRSDKVAGLFLLACPLYPRLTLSAAVQSLQVALEIPGKHPSYAAACRACSITGTKKLWRYLGWIPRFFELFAAAKLARGQIGQLVVPSTTVQSRHDELVAPRTCRLLAKAPCGQLHILPQSGHFYYPPADLNMLQTLFTDFLTRYH